MPNAIVNGISIDYSTAGDGPPVLLICGTGQPADLWFAQVTDLSRSRAHRHHLRQQRLRAF